MRRLFLVVAILGLAACSSGSSKTAATTNTTVATTTTAAGLSEAKACDGLNDLNRTAFSPENAKGPDAGTRHRRYPRRNKRRPLGSGVCAQVIP